MSSVLLSYPRGGRLGIPSPSPNTCQACVQSPFSSLHCPNRGGAPLSGRPELTVWASADQNWTRIPRRGGEEVLEAELGSREPAWGPPRVLLTPPTGAQGTVAAAGTGPGSSLPGLCWTRFRGPAGPFRLCLRMQIPGPSVQISQQTIPGVGNTQEMKVWGGPRIPLSNLVSGVHVRVRGQVVPTSPLGGRMGKLRPRGPAHTRKCSDLGMSLILGSVAGEAAGVLPKAREGQMKQCGVPRGGGDAEGDIPGPMAASRPCLAPGAGCGGQRPWVQWSPGPCSRGRS